MAEIIFKFDLSGDNGIDEERAAARCFRAIDMALVIHQIQEYLRSEVGLAEAKDSREAYSQAVQVYKNCANIISDHNIDIDELLI